MPKNQPYATSVVRNEDGWTGLDGQLNAEDAEILDRMHRAKIDAALEKLHEMPPPPRSENMGDFMANLATAKESLRLIRALTGLRASFGKDDETPEIPAERSAG
jgi:hypothetical protein